MEPIEILFKEYDTLRAESIARANNAYQLLGVGSAIAAALLTWIGSHGIDRILLASALMFIAILVFAFVVVTRDVDWVAFRLRQLEAEINSIAGAELLKWETHFGGSKHGWIFRKGPPPDDAKR